MTTFIRCIQAVSWLLHLCGLLLLLSLIAGYAAIDGALDTSRRNGNTSTAYTAFQRNDGQRFQQIVVSPRSIIFESGRGPRSVAFGTPWRVHLDPIVQLGSTPGGTVRGTLFSVQRVRTLATLPTGEPATTFLEVKASWGFLVFVALTLALLPLAVPPARRSIVGGYRRLAGRIAALSGAAANRLPWGRRPRGFEVIR